jgi:hypothetical protein
MDISLVLKCEVIILSGNIKQENPGRDFFIRLTIRKFPTFFQNVFTNILMKMSINILTKMLIDILENVPIFLKMLRHFLKKNIISVGRRRTGAWWPPTRRTSVWGRGGRRAHSGTVAPGRWPASSSHAAMGGRAAAGMTAKVEAAAEVTAAGGGRR